MKIVELGLLPLGRPRVGERHPRLRLVVARRADREDTVADREQILQVDDVG